MAGVTVRITCNNVLCSFQISKVNRCRGKSSYRRIIFFTFFTFAKLTVKFKGCNKSKSNEMFRGKPFENELGSIQKQSFKNVYILYIGNLYQYKRLVLVSVSSLQFLGKQRQIEKRNDHLAVSLAKECCAAECSAPDQSMLCEVQLRDGVIIQS